MFTKYKRYFPEKEKAIDRMRRNISNNVLGENLIPRIYKILQISSKKSDDAIQIWVIQCTIY